MTKLSVKLGHLTIINDECSEVVASLDTNLVNQPISLHI